ncbi:unnamed protein product [Rotaria sp. Silwood1]|nr:unnamed protein product [Rotaria sp. Silwood1]CAF3830887.1 unnamed protein product [Rotaria sp. Silwood1]CAF4056441.1 unnamed protein product [Rotaria sp. Silwood1]CAF4873614.1 unnamed protein product [Rotaria sp. Silwood1]CAF4922622.1 unnamed protein product [Rotaria sp. Silwood1]
MSPKRFQVRLYIIRHAESAINAASTHICGQNIPCKRLKYQNIKFDSILCSTVVRAERTAEIALKTMNIDISKLIISSELLEESQGSWEGMSRALAFTPEVIQQWNELHFEFCPPNGESKRMVQKRALAYLEPIIEQAKNQSLEENREISIGIFTHANLIQSILQYYLQSNPKYAWLIKQNNTAINEILLNEHGISVVKVNDDSHLRFLIPEMQNESLDNL